MPIQQTKQYPLYLNNTKLENELMHPAKSTSQRNFSQQIDPMHKLQETVLHFIQFAAMKNFENTDFYLIYHKYLTDLTLYIRACELAGYQHDKIIKVIEPMRVLLSASPFVKRMQEWPRGYPGDFETVEYLCHYKNRCVPGTLEYIIEQDALASPIVQQHRYKIRHQANMIKKTILAKKEPANIAILGCGGSEDLVSIQAEIAPYQPNIYLNDMDKSALHRSKENCQQLKNLHFLECNCLQALREMKKHHQFDLILAGGLFDYFELNRTSKIISQALKILNADGKLFFTNIVQGHPYRVMMEYMCNWFLYEKSAEELLNACISAGATHDKTHITRDETGLAYLVTIAAPSSTP